MLHGNERIVKHKIGLLNLAEELSNVSRACKIMGLSRDTFYRYKAAVGNGGIEALIDKSRRKPNIKNRVEEMTEAAVIAYAVEQPAYGQVRASNELRAGYIHLSKRGALCLAASSTGAVQGSLASTGEQGGEGGFDPHRGTGAGA